MIGVCVRKISAENARGPRMIVEGWIVRGIRGCRFGWIYTREIVGYCGYLNFGCMNCIVKCMSFYFRCVRGYYYKCSNFDLNVEIFFEGIQFI